jgi:UDP:flavonoid glycosyltransferase YjiC (YdhE family)
MICLLPMCAYLSETSRMVQIYKALPARGAAARIATHGGVHERLLRQEGIDYDLIEPHMDAARGQRFVMSNVGIGDPQQSMYEPDEMRAHVAAEAAYFARHGVTAAVTGFTVTALLSTRVARIPLIVEHAGAFLPPLFERNLLPASAVRAPPLLRVLPRPVARWLQNKGMPKLKLYLAGFDALAAELGVPPIPSFPALILGDLVLVTEAPEVYGVSEQEMKAWRPRDGAYWPTTRFEYTGPIFAEFDLDVPAAVEEALGRPGPHVYVALTSVTADVVRRVVRGVAASGANVIVAGTVHDLADLAGPGVTVGGVLAACNAPWPRGSRPSPFPCISSRNRTCTSWRSAGPCDRCPLPRPTRRSSRRWWARCSPSPAIAPRRA